MYQFNTLDAIPDPRTESSVGLIFNGIDLEAVTPEFLTLTVSGRGLIGRDLTSTPVPGRDGTVPTDSTLPARFIQVKYQLSAESNAHLRDTYERLNALLHSKDEAPIRFRDEPDCYFMGSLSAVSEPEESSNILVEELQFYCSRPFKYQDRQPVSGASINHPTRANLFGLMADFSFTPTANAAEIRVRNSLNQSIGIGPVVAGREYKLLLTKDRPEIRENGIRKMTLLSIESGLETFQVKPGLSYNLSTGGSLTATFKELRL